MAHPNEEIDQFFDEKFRKLKVGSPYNPNLVLGHMVPHGKWVTEVMEKFEIPNRHTAWDYFIRWERRIEKELELIRIIKG